MTDERHEAVRLLFAEAGVPDPPAILLEALAGMADDRRRELIRETTAEQLERMRQRATPAGRLASDLADLAAEDLADLRRCRPSPPTPETMCPLQPNRPAPF